MCGIAGVLERPPSSQEGALRDTVAAMAATLAHRGPDDDGTWVDAHNGIALGHTRLGIVDLSPGGRQPMTSRDERWTLAFNGEVYNHVEVRRRLNSAGVRLRSDSDTEVLLEAVAAWGVEKALGEANGMFALALWDGLERRLLLARDRLGEKPLYYGWFGRHLLFASELKALRRHPAFRGDIDRRALALYLRHGYVPAPHSIFCGVRKLPAAHLLVVSADGAASEPTPYWSVAGAARAGQRDPLRAQSGEAADAVEALLSDSVRLRMRADVPVGAFLSGGIDSSLVVALMRAHTSRPVRTFTIGFTEAGWDEAPHAAAVARHLGTDHTELYVTPHEAQAVIPSLPDVYDEPFADSSQIPTCLLAGLTRRSVTVSLSGDGGDELFAGYDRYLRFERLSRLHRLAPQAARTAVGRAVAARDRTTLERLLRPLRPLLAPGAPPGKLGDRALRAAGLLAGSSEDLYLELLSAWTSPLPLAAPADGASSLPVPPGELPQNGTARLRAIDQGHYLPDDLLVKVDRATMAVALEARVPFLDHRLVELAWRLPERELARRGRGKQVLRTALARHLPRELVDRPKMGFGVPVGDWLRDPLRDWAEDLLAPARLATTGLLDPAPIREIWAEHVSGGADHTPRLWAVLMLQSWLERWGPA